ncbi:ATP-dependent protease LonB [Oceanirhabdus sp. W0125-5]|uniref:ATP-dependent protease LonB n=1 Tax=Oceanirhabdus sp. W0125-5 TaxID=2999116 RepID=UPI0022F31130|nr:ATP-dependent protease LonB [Oceanirhabdus sp. W0125-5]WBW98915.1 ATP-dependent protease LonB [Oceanirhabdus sp. W0125-5]
MTTNVLMIIQMFFTVIIGLYFFNALKTQKINKSTQTRDTSKEMENLRRMRAIRLSVPLTEKSRPKKFDEIIGQSSGIEALKAAICGPNPQHVIIYGPPGVGKTAAARLVLEYAKTKKHSPFRQDSKFIEIDATTIRFDDRGIADPLIGSVHDPIYQGAGPLGSAGVPQPKPGAVTKAHGGVLFMDEIGELHPIEMNKLLKVMEDRKVFLDSAYYNSNSSMNYPQYIREVFENGLPADFRLIGATTRRPEEINPAIRSRAVEVFFRGLLAEETELIAKNAVMKMGMEMDEEIPSMVGKYTTNGREAVNLVQLACGIAINHERNKVLVEDLEWVIENGHFTPRPEVKINNKPQIGFVNGLAVFGANMGTLMEIEATAMKARNGDGKINITGVVEQEEITSQNRKLIRKSNARCSVENVMTVIKNVYNIPCHDFDIHVNFPGGGPVDGPSAGVSMTTAIFSAIKNIPVSNKVAMTGEVSIHGRVKPIGGVTAKIKAAIKAGVETVIIPKDNWQNNFENFKEIKIIPVSNINEVIEAALIKSIEAPSIEENGIITSEYGIISAQSKECSETVEN